MNSTARYIFVGIVLVSGTIFFHWLWEVNYLIASGGAIGLFLFYPLCKQILKKEVIQNPLTFFLWMILDAIAAGSTYLADGNYFQAALYSVGGLLVVTCALYAGGMIKWTWFESLVTFMAVVCVVIWVSTSNTMAALASILALMVASVPQMFDTWKNPKSTPTKIYLGYVLANSLATLGGKEVSIVEIGYPLSAVFICLLIFFFSLRKVQSLVI